MPRDPDADYASIGQVMRHVEAGILKQVLTCLPGLVVEYTAATQRAIVQPVPDVLLDDGSGVARAELVDVPVVWPHGGGWTVSLPLAADDSVLLLFAARDVSAFLTDRRRDVPPTPRVMSVQDAFAIPALGAAPEAVDGVSVSNGDGSTRLTLTEEQITLKAARIRFEYAGQDGAAARVWGS